MAFDENKQQVIPRPNRLIIQGSTWTSTPDVIPGCLPVTGAPFFPATMTIVIDTPSLVQYQSIVDPSPFFIQILGFTTLGPNPTWAVFATDAASNTAEWQGPDFNTNDSPLGTYNARDACNDPLVLTVIESP